MYWLRLLQPWKWKRSTRRRKRRQRLSGSTTPTIGVRGNSGIVAPMNDSCDIPSGTTIDGISSGRVVTPTHDDVDDDAGIISLS
jgi:hypothetical protein